MAQDLGHKLRRPWLYGARILGTDLVGAGFLEECPGLCFCQRDLFRLIWGRVSFQFLQALKKSLELVSF
jgi:hypothetical protein